MSSNAVKVLIKDVNYVLIRRFTITWRHSELIQEEPCIGYHINFNLLKGALLGIIKNRETVGAGVLLDLKNDKVKVLSKIDDFTGLILGYISLNDKFEERRIRFRKCES